MATQYRRLRHKFGAQSVEHDLIRFPSKLEGKYYQKLKVLKRSGDILFFLMQVPMHLTANIKYVIDFVEFWAPKEGEEAGDIVFTEIKGYDTAMGKLKRKQAEALYGIEINLVREV